MSTIHIAPPELATSPDGAEHTVSAAIDFAGTPLTLWYRFQGVIPECRAESFISPLLLAAMARHLPIDCAGPVSELYLHQLDTVQDIFATWVPAFGRIPVRAPIRPAEPPGPDAAAFFTGGVDSFHTMLAHSGEIRALVYVPDFEAPPGSPALKAEIRSRLQTVAAAMGMEFLVIDTNVRSAEILRVVEPGRFTSKHWNFELAHGAALAAAAHALPRRFARVYLAASSTYDQLFPWGSHPLLDPLWSTEARRIVHDGCAHTRTEKIARLGSSELALGALRVCTVQHRHTYNCGLCEKCLRTMVGLEIAGALSRSGTFPTQLSLLRVALLPNDERSHDYLVENLRAAEATGKHAALAAALRVALRPRSFPRRALRLGLSARRVVRSVVPYLLGG